MGDTLEMTMTAEEVREFMHELDLARIDRDSDHGLHVDYIGFIVGATYRERVDGRAVDYRCIHRTARYATFEAVDPWTGETVQFRRRVKLCGKGSPRASIGYLEDCRSPFGERLKRTECICSSNVA